MSKVHVGTNADNFSAAPGVPIGLGMEQDVVRKQYSLLSGDDLKAYWAHLENVCATSAR